MQDPSAWPPDAHATLPLLGGIGSRVCRAAAGASPADPDDMDVRHALVNRVRSHTDHAA